MSDSVWNPDNGKKNLHRLRNWVRCQPHPPTKEQIEKHMMSKWNFNKEYVQHLIEIAGNLFKTWAGRDALRQGLR